MARPRRQRGSLKKVKAEEAWKWRARWYHYSMVDGKEMRTPRKRFIGLCAQLNKTDAELLLQSIITEDNRPIEPVPVQPQPEALALTFSDICARYIRLREGSWAPMTRKTNASVIGKAAAAFAGRTADSITKEDLQVWLNDLAHPEKGAKSKSYVKKATTHLRSMFAEAVEERLLEFDVAKNLTVPKRTKKPSEAFLEMGSCFRLLTACTPRDHLILRIFLICGLRPGELFALRVDDIEVGRLRIDQTIYEGRIKDYAKTDMSIGWVAMPPGLEAEIRAWIATRDIANYPDEFLFVGKRGKPIHAGNFLRRELGVIGTAAGILDLNHQVLRRTTATHFQKHGTVKDTQTQMRHTDPETTLRFYQKTIPESLKNAVESWDAELFTPASLIRQ